jgi:4-hydroxybenzoate polyprenyltransferase
VTLTTAYSLYLKRTLFLDVLVLALLYTYRVFTGAMVADVPVSQWLMGFSMFLFVSLALLKRYVELREFRSDGQASTNRRGYLAADADILQVVGPVSGYLAVLVLCLYVSSDDVRVLYRHANLLWLLTPVLLYWITRLWLLARRGLVTDDPVSVALKDKTSYLCGLVCVALLVAASA